MKEEVLIIESRSAADHYSNRSEATILTKILALGGVKTKCLEVLNERYFVKAIQNAENETVKFVHFSGHGTENGIQLTTGKLITWERLDNITWPILKGKCLVFSSCLVANGVEKIFEYHRTYCNAIVAPTREIGWDEGLVAYSAFYHRAKNPDTTTDADVRVMNHIAGKGTFKFISPKNSPIAVLGQ